MSETEWDLTWALDTAKRLGAAQRELEIIEMLKKQPVEVSRDMLIVLILEDGKK